MTDTATTEAPSPKPSPPDRAALREDVRCPLCEYDLRGLAEPRCPECGFTFEWNDLFDPTRKRHPFLFEHHPERNVGSFVATVRATLWPKAFWTTLYPTQPTRPGLIALYAVLVVAFCAIEPAVRFAHYLLWLNGVAESPVGVGRTFWPPAGGWSNAQVAWHLEIFMHVLALLQYVLWAGVTFLSLLVFRVSMRRARISPVHVARCVVYGFDVVFWVAAPVLVFAVAALLLGLMGYPIGWPPALMLTATVLIAVLVPVTVVYRLTRAYRHYLRFDRPLLTVLASQVITLLVYVNVMLFLSTRDITL